MAGVTLRSAQWYAGEDRNAYIHRAWMRRGVPAAGFERPQIAIANTASDLTPCNMHLSEVARSVRRQAGYASDLTGSRALGGQNGPAPPGVPLPPLSSPWM